jgi:hypothetical protein
VLAVGLVLRLLGIGSSFWVDEVDTVLHSVRLPVGRIVASYESENQHPLYSLLAHLCTSAFGEHEWSVRLPAVLFGVASLAAVARLGRQVIDGMVGLLAALLLAVSYHHVWFSQNARGYTGLLLFTVLATSELLELFVRPTRGGVVRYALWCALALYTHLTAGFAIVGHALVWFVLKARPAKPWTRATVDCQPLPPPRATGAAFVALAAGGVLALLLYAPMLGDLIGAFTARATQSTASVARVVPWTKPGWAFSQLLQSFGLGVPALIGLGVVGVLFLIGLGSLWNNGRRAFVAMHLLPLPIAAAVLLGLKRHLYPRYFFFEIGFAAIVLARGALISGGWLSCSLPGCKERRTRLWGMAVALLMAGVSCLSLSPLYEHPKQDFTGARDFVESQARAGDAKVAVGPARLALTEYYAPTWTGLGAEPGEREPGAAAAAKLAALSASAPRTWVVYTLPDQLRAALPAVAAQVERDFELVRELPGSLAGGTVFVRVSRR